MANEDMRADGQLKVVYVASIADIENPTVAEVTAGSTVDLSCFLLADGGFDHTVDEETVDNAKLCDVTDYEQPGRFKHQLTITYARKQLAADDEAYTTLKRGTGGYVVTRWGKPADDALIATDVIDVYTITCGAQQKQAPERNSIAKVQQRLFVSGPVAEDVEVAA